MDSRERVRTALAGKRPDRVPCALGFFSQSLFGSDDADELFQTDVRFVEFAPPPGQDRFLKYLESRRRGYTWEAAHNCRPTTNGATILRTPRPSAPPGLRALSARMSRLLPQITEPRRHAHLAELVRGLHARGVAVAGAPPHLGGELFESAWRLRGFELFMEDLLERPDLVEYLLDQVAAMAAESAGLLAKAGVDVLLLDDDVAHAGGLLISPGMWRRFFKPRLAQIIEAGRRVAPDLLVFYHSDGNFAALLADLVEIGVDVVNPVAPDCMDASAIRRTFGRRLALWGTVGTAWMWDHGSPSQVREEVRRRIESLGGAGLLLSPAYDLDYAPRENVAAFVQAVHDFG